MTRRSPTPSPQTPQGGVTRYGSHILDDKRHDPYAPTGSHPSPARCNICGAVYLEGRWRWTTAPKDAIAHTCPACRRIADALPAGWLRVEGEFARAHRAELVAIVRHQADRERSDHPMNRVIALDETADGFEVSTTDIHLPQRIGEALRSAHQGELDVHYGKDEYSVRVTWRR